MIVFAGPNGSGKSTIAKMAKIIEPYVNADDIKRVNVCSDIDAAQIAEKMRIQFVNEHKSFTFETVLSTDRNLKLLKKSKQEGFFIRCIYVLTTDANINVLRVKTRKESGGHDVPIYQPYEGKVFDGLSHLVEPFTLYDSDGIVSVDLGNKAANNKGIKCISYNSDKNILENIKFKMKGNKITFNSINEFPIALIEGNLDAAQINKLNENINKKRIIMLLYFPFMNYLTK